MEGTLIVNHGLNGEKYREQTALYREAANCLGISLQVCTNAQRPASYGDFVLFLDKDVILARTLELAGLPVFNSASAIALCDDKARTYLALAGKDIPMPKTLVLPMTFFETDWTDNPFLPYAEEELGYPMVVKEAFGSFGRQVYLVHNRKELERTVLALDFKPFLLQEFIAESAGRDVRINVVGGKVFCAILRENAGDFRSNITGGGKGVAYEPTPAEAEIALAACRALGLDYGGVDVLFGKDGPLVCEVNSNPHFKSTYDCTGLDMSVAIMRYVKGETV